MTNTGIILIVVSAVILLLLLVLKVKLNSFLALLMVSVYVGVLTGMPLRDILVSIQNGMGSTLGFIAVVVGLGAIFGQILESSGGAEALAHRLVRKFGNEKASWAMLIAGFVIAIPVFFDVGFIIMVPIIYALSRDTKRSLLYYAIPLLAGLAVTHSFIPPTPGPVAVADIIGVPLGWVILFGFILGIPTAIIAGPVFGKYIAAKMFIEPPENDTSEINTSHRDGDNYPGFSLVAFIIGIPLLLIVAGTIMDLLVEKGTIADLLFADIVIFLGHPFSALLIATLTAWYFLGLQKGQSKAKMLEISTKALAPAGVIILITGAGGVLKQVLVDSGIGESLADSLAGSSQSVIFLSWAMAALVRITQGSATVAMITAAGIISPVLEVLVVDDMQKAVIVLAIASGATILSHVNDSGFWLVGRYLGLDEKQTLRTWTSLETIIALCGLVFCLIAGYILNLF
jgi:Gnt-I system low-affinity gluconate transporter